MRRRAPGVVGEGVEVADGVDPRQRVGGGQFAWRDRGQRRGAMAALERIERACRALRFTKRRGDLGRDLPADGRGLRAERGLGGDRAADRLRRPHGPPAQVGGARIVRGALPGGNAARQYFRQPPGMVERMQRAGQAQPLGLRLGRLLQFGQEVPHLLDRGGGRHAVPRRRAGPAGKPGRDRGGHRGDDVRHHAPGGLDRDHRIGERARVERALQRGLP